MIKIGVNKIGQTDSTKFLGIVVDENLTFKKHIDYIANKISKTVGLLHKLKYSLPSSILKNIYVSLIEPYILYGKEALSVGYSNITDRILVLQKKAVRAIMNAPYNAHTAVFLNDLRILKAGDIGKIQLIKMIYQTLKLNKYESIHPYLNRNASTHRYSTRTNNHLSIPRYRLSISQRSALYRGINLWNNAEAMFGCDKSLFSFIKELKSNFIEHYI